MEREQKYKIIIEILFIFSCGILPKNQALNQLGYFSLLIITYPLLVLLFIETREEGEGITTFLINYLVWFGVPASLTMTYVYIYLMKPTHWQYTVVLLLSGIATGNLTLLCRFFVRTIYMKVRSKNVTVEESKKS